MGLSRGKNRDSESYLRALLEICSDGVAVVSPDATIMDASASLEQLCGLPGALSGSNLREVLHPEEADRALSYCHLAATEGGVRGPARWRMRAADGSWRLVEVVIHNLLRHPSVAGLVINVRDISQVTALEQRLKHDAFKDALTGLGNRVVLFDRVRVALMRQKSDAYVAVLFLDLDDFKTVNDSWGHAAGDELLVGIAERLGECLRPGDMAARLGGDEFAVLLEDLKTPDQAGEVAQRIITGFRDPFTAGRSHVGVQVSIGISIARPGQQRAEELLRDADVAMYAAKARGKGRYEYFHTDMRVGAVEKLELRDALQRAIDQDDFMLHYQPIIGLRDGLISGAEALIRWRDRERGVVPPGRFVAIAEESGLMDSIGRWVIRQACFAAQRWQFSQGRAFRMAVNLSARQLDQPGFAEGVANALRSSGLEPTRLVFELTEQTFMQDSDVVLVNLHELKELGVRLAIDDFGTGYSSLSYLQRFPVDFLKIDKSFVDELGTDSERPALARAIVQIAHSMDLTVIAEGVESPEQLQHLQDLDCDYAQGYLFAKPLDQIEMANFITPEPLPNVVRLRPNLRLAEGPAA